MSDILLGSETWQIHVTCIECAYTELMYVPVDLEVNDVRLFLIGRGWVAKDAFWTCPKPHGGSDND